MCGVYCWIVGVVVGFVGLVYCVIGVDCDLVYLGVDG